MSRRINLKNLSVLFFLTFSIGVQAQSFERVETIIGLDILEDNNGVAIADYDGDNDLDIFVVAKAKDNSNNPETLSRLFRNNNDGSFTDVTQQSGFSNLYNSDQDPESFTGLSGYKFGAFWGDYNNDGYPDLFMTFLDSVQLWKNLGNGTFTDVTSISGITKINNCGNTGATWFDYNNDGFLDLFIADWIRCSSNTLYINNGDETFLNVSETSGDINNNNYFSYVGFPFDFNIDGFMDLYVINDKQTPNELFENQGGYSFLDNVNTNNLNNSGQDMGITMGDYNLDGYFDIFITGIDENFLFTNDGDGAFLENSNQLGINNTLWSWGTRFADFDLDGDEDLFVANGFDMTNRGEEPNFYYNNLAIQGEIAFTDLSAQLGLNELGISVEANDFDYDNDGDIDLLVSNSDRGCFFYENKLLNFDDSQAALNWFKVKLEGTISNRDAIGTVITLITTEGVYNRYYSGVGFLSQNLQPVHFGLGNTTQIETVNIKWPSGLIDTFDNLVSNITIKATEGQGYQVLNILPSQKTFGCTDPSSCNYNPEAVLDDGSCVYLESQNIIGNTSSSFLSTETYSYDITAGANTIWQVSGGEILSGQGTNSISVRWQLEDSGRVAITESDNQCSSQEVSIIVDLEIENLSENISVARLWNEALLEAIRGDFARPTVHARNLFHTSVAMYDIWAVYDNIASPYLIGNTVNGFSSVLEDFTPGEAVETALNKSISYAMYRLLSHRFQNSPSAETSQARFNMLMTKLGYDTNFTAMDYLEGDAAAFGNYVAQTIIDYGLQDGSREATGYDNAYYQPVNETYALDGNSNAPINDPNRWQPLGLDSFIDQSGNIIDTNAPPFLSPEWGNVASFALSEDDKITFQRNGNDFNVFHNPLDPPYISVTEHNSNSDAYKWGFSMVSVWQSHLDQNDGVMWDISPNTIGNVDISTFPTNFDDYPSFYNFFEGGSNSNGHTLNPITESPYETNLVPRGDYTRVLAEFWADGPHSETPPGHWFTILNYVNDHPQFEKRFEGEGAILTSLEWDVKSYFILGGGMHDSAISAWSVKGWYDYIRPISAIRTMAANGQSTDPTLANYNVAGIPLLPNYIEVVEEGDPLAGFSNQHIGKIKLFTWRGHDFISNTETQQAGVGWILADDWYPYQRPTFVTPPFAGYVSGHSTFSRAAAELMTKITGSAFFPGGLGEFTAKANEFLVFEQGPSVDVVLQWATYRDASDQTSLSRIWGGIHPPADDIPGRFIGQAVADDVFDFAVPYFNGSLSINEFENDISIFPNPTNGLVYLSNVNASDKITVYDVSGRAINIAEEKYDALSNTISIKINVADGVYFVKINTHVKTIIVKK
ncbi:FG-GAP-like repeat-containing protein [uncultured Winogradskyella sp.]|uniref:FG-GAP-like repeat-containing protein n=1 Tax=uncultured Winogradskyella sp. TaxID=395353 RepID=UPI0030DB3DB6|tara:strand:+ start:41032 stop:45054 length:4023 start_codon:yes stop_codon:yes gene_type:complete